MGAGASAEVDKNKELLDDLDRLVHKQHRLMEVAFSHAQKGTLATQFTTEEEVAARLIPSGTCAYIWKQDPSVERIGIRKVFLPHMVRIGPKDDLIEVVLELKTKRGTVERDLKATTLAKADNANDFLQDIEGDPFAFDLVHVYSVVRMTLDMYIRDLKIDWKWQWDQNLPAGAAKTPLRIITHAGEKANAVYHRGKRALKFYFYTVDKKTTYLCRSFDIVAHETGHAILDALKPALYAVHEGQPGALHESFADLTAIFSVLNQLDLCEDIIAETKGNLRKATYVTAIGEQFASVMKGEGGALPTEDENDDSEMAETAGMRNANNNITGTACGTDMYQMANVFSGFVWDVLVEVFNWERNPKFGSSDAETLHRVACIVRKMLLLALFNAPKVPNFTDIALAMEKAADIICREDKGDVIKYQQIIARSRSERELADAGVQKEKYKIDLGDY